MWTQVKATHTDNCIHAKADTDDHHQDLDNICDDAVIYDDDEDDDNDDDDDDSCGGDGDGDEDNDDDDGQTRLITSKVHAAVLYCS